MASGPMFSALDGAACVCIVSYERLVERGLGSLPGGDESVLVKGVRACADEGWPERDMALAAEKMDECDVGVEVVELASFNSSPGRRAWSSSAAAGEGELGLSSAAHVSSAACEAVAADRVERDEADEATRREAARRKCLFSRSLRLCADMGSALVLECRGLAAERHPDA